jgi:hypothetical protein
MNRAAPPRSVEPYLVAGAPTCPKCRLGGRASSLSFGTVRVPRAYVERSLPSSAELPLPVAAWRCDVPEHAPLVDSYHRLAATRDDADWRGGWVIVPVAAQEGRVPAAAPARAVGGGAGDPAASRLDALRGDGDREDTEDDGDPLGGTATDPPDGDSEGRDERRDHALADVGGGEPRYV